MSADIDGIRKRHAEYDRVPRATGFNSSVDQAHADRAALLAEVTKWQQAVQVYGEAADYWRPIAEQAREALDRLAAVTVDEVAQAIAETRGPSPSGVGTVWHGVPWATANQVTYRAMAAAVLALLRSRMAGQP